MTSGGNALRQPDRRHGCHRLGPIELTCQCQDAATRRALAGKPKVRRFFQTAYAARSWSKERRVIARVEATALGADVRFIVTGGFHVEVQRYQANLI